MSSEPGENPTTSEANQPQNPTPGGMMSPGIDRRSCPPVNTVCCAVGPGEKPCCTQRSKPPTELPPGEGPTEIPELVDDDSLARLKKAYEATHGDMFNRSLMKKYLSRSVFDDLKYKKTKDGSTLLDVIRSGSKCPDSIVGAYAPDAESYNRFAKLFHPIVWEYHKGFSPTDQHPPTNWGNPAGLPNLDPCEGIVMSVRVSCSRNIVGFPLLRHIKEEQLSQLEQKVLAAFDDLDDEFKGDYEPRAGMTDDYYSDLRNNHLIFIDQNIYLEAALPSRLSKSRGIFLNKDRTFLVWVGVEDHLKIISLQKGGNIAEVYARLVEGMKKLEMNLQFQKHSRLGYITMCPSNLGNTIRASAVMKLPYSGYDDDQLRQNVENLNLELGNAEGGNNPSKNCIHKISNRRRIGLTELASVNEMVLGVKEIIKVERTEQRKSSKTPEEMIEEQQKMQKSKEEEKEKDRHRRFARKNPDGMFSEHQDPRVGSTKDKKKDKRSKKSMDRGRDKSIDRGREKSMDRDRDKSIDRGREKSMDRSREAPWEKDREKSRADRENSSDRDTEKPGDKDREKPRERSKDKPRDRDRNKDKERRPKTEEDREKEMRLFKGQEKRPKSEDVSRERKPPRDEDKRKEKEGKKDESNPNRKEKRRDPRRDEGKSVSNERRNEKLRERKRRMSEEEKRSDEDRIRERHKRREKERRKQKEARREENDKAP